MVSSARIDELQKKFNENPRRYFAPLADEYRKLGDLAAAIELCRSHLAQQPGHMSGHIVLGKALYESGQLDEARQTFLTALELDPENLIALRHLGDIARQQGDSYGARQWYQRVLDADPRNDEIAAQVRELDAMPATQAFGGGEAVAGGYAGQAGRDADLDTTGLADPALPPELEEAPDTLAESPVADGSLPPAIEPAGLAYMADESTLEAPAARGDDMLDLDAADFDLGMSDTPALDATPSAAAEPVDFMAGSGEFDEGLDAFADIGGDAVDEAPAPTWSSSAPTPPSSHDALGLESMEFEAPTGQDRAPRAEGLETPEYEFDPHVVDGDVHGDPTPAAFVTETMAELYLQQGFHEEALQVYKQLLEADPGDENLQARVRSLEGGGRSTLAFEVSEDVVRAAQERHARSNRPTARRFFASLAARRAPDRGGDVQAYAPVPYDVTGADTSVMDAAALEDSHAAPAPWTVDPQPGVAHAASGEFDAYLTGEDALPEVLPAPDAADPFTADPYTTPSGAWGGVEHETPARGTGEYDVSAYETSAWQEAAPAPEAPAPAGPARRPTPSAPTVTGSVDALFGEPDASPEDLAAAEALAGAFAGTPAAVPAVRPATGELSLDQVFRDTPRRSSQAQRRESSGFSFDQFFSENAAEASPADAPAPPAPPTGAPEGADIEQFTAWLEGLKKK